MLGVAYAVLLVGAVAVRRRRRLGHVQQPEHGGDDGHRADQPPRDRRRRADDAAEHGRGDLDRVRAGDRHLLGRQGHAVRDLLGRDHRALGGHAGPVRGEHAHRAVGAGRDARWPGPGSACCGRGGTEGVRIGELAREAGTTPRTVRYYEEIGLLAAVGERAAGSHREYGSAMWSGCGRSCGSSAARALARRVAAVVEGEDARAERRREWR